MSICTVGRKAEQVSVAFDAMLGGPVSTALSRSRRLGAAAGIALAASLFGASGALAQNCAFPASTITNLAAIGASPAAISGMIGSAITAADTAFLLQNEAFIGAPANPAADQQGGGVWVRGVGGQVSIKSSTSTAVSDSATGASAVVPCSQKVDTDFAGVQFGADMSRLNVNGWNLHFGATAGYLGTKGNLVGGTFSLIDPATGLPEGGGPFTSTTQVPFFGIYGAATHGGFFVSGLLREEFYQTSLSAPGANLFGQEIDAHGWAFAGSVGYNWAIPNSKWFIEPSAGVSISRTKVDPFNFVTAGTVLGTFNDQLSGTLRFNDINSDIGRLGLRFGTTIEGGSITWQPFGAVSVWHEFGSNVTSNYATCPGCVVLAPAGTPTIISGASSTSTFGTYGQYSAGIAGAVNGTGWVGFARVDYRDGANLQGLSGTGGIRYQFSPEQIRGVMPVKAPVYKAPIVQAVNWTGFYLGGFGGADLGTADWNYGTGSAKPYIGGFLGGGDIGYNYQTGAWVWGVEGDLAGTNTKGGIGCGPLSIGATFSPMFEVTCSASNSWLASVTGRIGYAWGRALLYVKGGGAWTNERFAATCNAPAAQVCSNAAGVAPFAGLTASTTRTGWTVGYGTEFALTQNWSARAETDYASFGDSTVTASDGSVLNVGMHLWEAKIGVNYRFSSAAIATRY